MKKIKFYFVLIPIVTFLFSCASAGKVLDYTIVRGTGPVLGTASATASVSANRKTGKMTGDTMNYGYIINENENKNSQVKRLAKNSLTNATDTAYANALYDIIQQAKMKGGDALNEVVSTAKRSFDLNTDTETVTVTITANIVKTN